MGTEAKKYFYDVTKNPVGEIAGAFLEERVDGDIRQRINNADPIRTRGGVPDIKFREDYNEYGPTERRATLNTFALAKSGYNLIFWISPEDGGKVYKEGRFNIHLARKEPDGEIVIKGKGIPLLLDRFESVKLAERLMDFGGMPMDPIYGVEGVREQPVGFELDNIEDWIGACREMMPEFENFWRFFERQGDLENKKRMERDVEKALAIAGDDNYVFEMVMARMGNMINATGGHGGSWLGQEGINSFSMRMVGRGAEVRVEKTADGKMICPCGEILKEGMTRCSRCGAKLVS